MQDKDIVSKLDKLSYQEMLARCFVYEKILEHLKSNIEGEQTDDRKREIMRSKIALSKISQFYNQYLNNEK